MKKLLPLIFCVFTLTTEVASATELSEPSETQLSLPHNCPVEESQGIVVNIPDTYQPWQPGSANDQMPGLVFLLHQDSDDESEVGQYEIITIHENIGVDLSAEWIAENFKENISQLPQGIVLFEEISPNSDPSNFSIIARHAIDKNEMILGLKFLSSPSGNFYVSYGILLSSKVSEQDAVEKIKIFFQEEISSL